MCTGLSCNNIHFSVTVFFSTQISILKVYTEKHIILLSQGISQLKTTQITMCPIVFNKRKNKTKHRSSLYFGFWILGFSRKGGWGVGLKYRVISERGVIKH